MNDYKEQKSERHSKVTGDFGEYLVLYYLSREGFECAHVDQIGLDIVGRAKNKELIGVSVKSRSGKQPSILIAKNAIKEKRKIEYAASIFGCIPYYAFVMDYKEENGGNQRIIIHIVKAERVFQDQQGNEGLSWSMSKRKLNEYSKDDSIIKVELDHVIKNWF